MDAARLVPMAGEAAEAGPRETPRQVRVAGLLVAAEALAAIGFAGVLLFSGLTGGERIADVVAQGVLFLLFGAGMAAVAVGLLVGRRWARAPGLVIQFLLLPVVYSLIGPSRQVVVGLAAGVLVVVTLVLLLSQQAKHWAMESFDRSG